MHSQNRQQVPRSVLNVHLCFMGCCVTMVVVKLLCTVYHCTFMWCVWCAHIAHSSLSAGKQKDLSQILFLLSSLFKSCCMWTMSCDCVLFSAGDSVALDTVSPYLLGSWSPLVGDISALNKFNQPTNLISLTEVLYWKHCTAAKPLGLDILAE